MTDADFIRDLLIAAKRKRLRLPITPQSVAAAMNTGIALWLEELYSEPSKQPRYYRFILEWEHRYYAIKNSVEYPLSDTELALFMVTRRLAA